MLMSENTSKQDVPNADSIPYMGIIDLFFPKICVGCRREGQYICDNCQRKLITPEPICPMCCKPSLDGWVHARCKTKYGMERLLVGLPYRGMVQNCLKKVKYRSSWDVIGFLLSLCDFGDISADFAVTAVPMFAPKERERGFNQAQLIAELFVKKNKGRIFVFLERVRSTKPMFGLTKMERQENIVGAFQINVHQAQMPNAHTLVIIVDDVWTTGATMRECARALKQAGINEVWGVTLAR